MITYSDEKYWLVVILHKYYRKGYQDISKIVDMPYYTTRAVYRRYRETGSPIPFKFHRGWGSKKIPNQIRQKV